ncbi:MAG: hypothetical protein DRI57_20950 [Deltaproteobacteria bacterium]|nr:MAG: hypothetical protein DRI57_20950 [Deltaproteobacteria bacterium]
MKACAFDEDLLHSAPFIVKSSKEMVLPRGSALFLRYLDGIPRKGICRCPICSNFFVNASYRDKIYCSSKCQNTAANKRLRDRKKKRRRNDPRLTFCSTEMRKFSNENQRPSETAQK